MPFVNNFGVICRPLYTPPASVFSRYYNKKKRTLRKSTMPIYIELPFSHFEFKFSAALSLLLLFLTKQSYRATNQRLPKNNYEARYQLHPRFLFF